jgi:hypothetical protein
MSTFEKENLLKNVWIPEIITLLKENPLKMSEFLKNK